ncbi:hypothetical protein H3H37_11010 [Duganella sp. LX20W]|uniref:Uncharacterized protein n=1 Tax=Rugamonas brunnea TaxID=2758569 RepID=A0A7W2ES31_9BURK|nr:hypothetical protein [Rugamonas brunnea]MBA5637583.1 hypothetical protein [Rugamonas brunnea]
MRLPGTRYQEHGWEQVRKLLGRCSLQAFRQLDMHLVLDSAQQEALLAAYVDTLAACLRARERLAGAEAAGNSYGDSVCELALSLAFELHAHPAFWHAFVATLVAEHARGGPFWNDPAAEAALRKKVNDMYAGLRDKVDADNYMVATGRDCTPNKIYTYRMLDTAWHELAQLFANRDTHRERLAVILDRAPGTLEPEIRQARSIADCKAEWIIRWSETQERYTGSPGPLHTRSKRFSSLRNNPARIAAMLTEIGDYEQLSSNQDRADPWQDDAGEAALWLEDYWRVIAASEAQEAAGGACAVADQILPAPETEDAWSADEQEPAELAEQAGPAGDEPVSDVVYDAAQLAAEQSTASALSLPPRYLEMARAAQESSGWAARVLREVSLPIRLAVYHKLLGPDDDSYPDDWRDVATGALPTLQQLAGLDGISMPTLRKRRDEAIARLYAASTGAAQ